MPEPRENPIKPDLVEVESGVFVLPAWPVPDWNELPKVAFSPGSGRGRAFIIHHPKGRLVERHYRHGGFRGRFFPSLFWPTKRAEREFTFHRKALHGGIQTLVPVGWRRWSGTFWPLRKYAYYTVFEDDCIPLPQYLKKGNPAPSLIEQIAATLSALQGLGLFHADLNLNNWLISEGRVLLIDFDKARNHSLDKQDFLVKSLDRMTRSAQKLGLMGARFAFFRLLVTLGRITGLNHRRLLNRLAPRDHRPGRSRKLGWLIAGGHRQ